MLKNSLRGDRQRNARKTVWVLFNSAGIVQVWGLSSTWNQSKSMRMELSSILRIGLRKNTQDRKDCDFHFSLFFKKVTFFRPKKGSLNRLIPVANPTLEGSTFRIPKNRCVKVPVSTSMCPPPYFPLAKMNYFSDEERTNEEEERTFQILHSPK